MFRNRERMVKVLVILLAAALAITLVLPFLGRT
jgi:cytochrome c-type biogenesis protein CcmE